MNSLSTTPTPTTTPDASAVHPNPLAPVAWLAAFALSAVLWALVIAVVVAW